MKIIKRNKGSMVVEAALILPIFLSLILLLITFIKISIVEITLTNNVHEVTEEISTHIYPIGLMYYNFSQTDIGEKVEESVDTIDNTRESILEIEELINNYAYLLPDEINRILNVGEMFESGITEVYDNTLSTIFQPIVDYHIDDKIIHLENLHVTKVVLPNLIDGDQPYIGIEVCYEMPLNIPFFNQTIAIKKMAYERIWMGDEITVNKALVHNNSSQQEDSIDENSEESEDEGKSEQIKIDYISSPVQRGKKVRIIAEGPKNTKATIKLVYPSGFEKEITSRFNDMGILVKNIIIGGHSNEGSTQINGETYQVIVKSCGIQDSGSFEVLSKDHMNQYLLNRLDNLKSK